MSSHPAWCDPKSCTAHHLAGSHRGAVRRVLDSRGRTVASVWLESDGAEVRVGYAVGLPIGSWAADVAAEFAEALAEVAERAEQVRV